MLQEDLLKILPMINEANAMSEELDKKVWFSFNLDIVIISSSDPLQRNPSHYEPLLSIFNSKKTRHFSWFIVERLIKSNLHSSASFSWKYIKSHL